MRKRVPLQLKGTDEQYFRTREIRGDEADGTTGTPPPRAETPAPPADTAPSGPEDRPGRDDPAKTPPVGQPRPKAVAEPETISRIVPLGRTLSRQVQATAERFGVPVDDLMYAARKKAVARFRRKLSQSQKPVIAEIDKGGETIRIAVALSGEEMAQLRRWFDPLDIGLATKMVAPLLAEALRREVKAICDAAARPGDQAAGPAA